MLLPMFSVPANQGIGDLGQKTIRMIDEIAAAGYKIWEILPLQMTGVSHSPYQTLSSFAGDPIYINIDRLSEIGLLTQSSIVNCNKFKDVVYYDEVRAFKETYFRKAFRVFRKNFEMYKEEFEKFASEAFWLKDWCIYALFKSLYDNVAWIDWEEEYRDYPLDPSNIDLKEHQNELFYQAFLQFIFYKQLDEVTEYAHSKGLMIMNDMPFYVDYDSAEVWMNRARFLLGENGRPSFVAGCPPDTLTKGQRWDMPLYNFKAQAAEGYRFWKDRASWLSRNFDILRIDHFRAFDKYWRIPADKDPKQGRWVKGPGQELLEILIRTCPHTEWAAEDIGDFGKGVDSLEEQFHIPGMEILIDHLDTKSLKKPFKKDIILYSGTYDSPTCEEEYGECDSNKRISLRRFFKKRDYNARAFHDMFCPFALDSDADTVILTMQDVCGYKGQTRINVTGTVDEKNWTWKLKDFKTFPAEMEKSKQWIERSGRSDQNTEKEIQLDIE